MRDIGSILHGSPVACGIVEGVRCQPEIRAYRVRQKLALRTNPGLTSGNGTGSNAVRPMSLMPGRRRRETGPTEALASPPRGLVILRARRHRALRSGLRPSVPNRAGSALSRWRGPHRTLLALGSGSAARKAINHKTPPVPVVPQWNCRPLRPVP